MKPRGKPADIRIEKQGALTARGVRSPSYDYANLSIPYMTLNPVMIAPVLPGDTVKALSFMANIHTDAALAGGLVGAWFESWHFYCRIGDLPDAADYRAALVGAGAFPSAAMIRLSCMEAIYKGHFMDEEEDYGTITGDAWFLKYPGSGWWQSAADQAAMDSIPGGSDEWEGQWHIYQQMRRSRLTTATFEEYLAMQGIAVPPQLRHEHDPEMKVPELLRYSREFAYPQFAGVDGEGNRIFQLRWFINDRLDRARFCAEPGFLVSCIAVRPKVYQQPQATFDALDLMRAPEAWAPTALDTDPHVTLDTIPGAVFGDTVGGAAAWVDRRDLLLYGDALVGDAPPPAINLADLAYVQRPQVVPEQDFAADVHIGLSIASRVSKDTTA